MITIIRNDRQAKFIHDVYGVKIKDEKPIYKVVGTLNNEGICIFESANYREVATVFELIMDAVINGEKAITINAPVATQSLTKEEYDETIHDYCGFDSEHKPEYPCDIYGRPLPPNYTHSKPGNWFINPDNDCQPYYNNQYQNEVEGFRTKFAENDKYSTNKYVQPSNQQPFIY